MYAINSQWVYLASICHKSDAWSASIRIEDAVVLLLPVLVYDSGLGVLVVFISTMLVDIMTYHATHISRPGLSGIQLGLFGRSGILLRVLALTLLGLLPRSAEERLAWRRICKSMELRNVENFSWQGNPLPWDIDLVDRSRKYHCMSQDFPLDLR
jgi:hypothetical protein